MRLSDLKTGELGVIVKILGHGAFRKRVIEMGFVKGQVIKVLLNAPLKDPIKYSIMGYELSLRRSEAEMVEVLPVNNMDEKTIESKRPDISGLSEIKTACILNMTAAPRLSILH